MNRKLIFNYDGCMLNMELSLNHETSCLLATDFLSFDLKAASGPIDLRWVSPLDGPRSTQIFFNIFEYE